MKWIILSSALALLAIKGKAQIFPLFTESYSSNTGWTPVHMLTGCANATTPADLGPPVNISAGAFNFNGSQGEVQNRMYKYFSSYPAAALSNTSWTSEFTFNFHSFPLPNNTVVPGHILAGFTNGILDPYNVIGQCSNPTNQDAIVVEYLSVTGVYPDRLNSAYWYVRAKAKDGTVWSAPSAGIHVNTGPNYIRVQRLSATQGVLSIFQDPAMTIHLSGSPQCFSIPATTQNLNVLQHGVIPQGGWFRRIWGTIDNLSASNTVATITGPSSVGCSPCIPNPPIYYYSVVGVPGATTGSYWTYSPGVTQISISPDKLTVGLKFSCGYTGATIMFTPDFGSGIACSAVMEKSIYIYQCIISDRIAESQVIKETDVYPNPNNGSFFYNYELQESGHAQFMVMDLAGREIASYELSPGINTLSIDNALIDNGIYLYKVIHEGGMLEYGKFSVVK